VRLPVALAPPVAAPPTLTASSTLEGSLHFKFPEVIAHLNAHGRPASAGNLRGGKVPPPHNARVDRAPVSLT
jgi:hypothetical protein